MCGAAQTKAMSKKSCPVFSCAQVSFGEAFAREIFRSFFSVGVVGIPPEPRCQCLVLLRHHRFACSAFVLFRLGCEKSFESRARQFSRVPRMIRSNLWIAHVGGKPSSK